MITTKPPLVWTLGALCLMNISLGIASAADEAAGLIGIQYGADDFEDAQHFVRLTTLNQQWREEDEFGKEWAGRWHGSIVGPTTGQVELTAETDQHVRVEIRGKIVLDTKMGLTTGQVRMDKGERYPIELTYLKVGPGYDCRLTVQWSWADHSPVSIEGKNLSHSAETAAELKKRYELSQDDDSDRKTGDGDEFVDTSRAKGVAFHKRAGQMLITIDGKPFATYVWSDPQTTRPYFKQVHALGGEIQITRNHPPRRGDLSDHESYHPGIWWGFGDVGGNDYWRMRAKVVGGWFTEEPTGGENRGSFAVRNRMMTNDGQQKFCDQLCRYTIVKRPGGILMICESTLTRAEGGFWLGDQEEMGMAIRVATPIATKSGQGGLIRDSEGRTEHQQIRTNQSDWCDYSGPIAGKHGGILLMNDPGNFRKPWWHAVDTGLLIANPLGESELSGRGKKRENVFVERGKPFRLRYGVLVHLHDTSQGFDPAKQYEEFLKALSEENSTGTTATRSDLPKVPDGFDISVFAREPRVYKPTAICFDAQGRLLVGQGPQYPRNYENSPTDSVVLLIDSDHDGRADESKTFATGFNSVQGLAWKGNALYVANAPELTVVRDLDGDDEADEYTIVYTDLGNREHALHGLNWGPDGKLYMSKGNSKGHNQPEKYGYVAPRPFRELWDVVHPPGAPDSYPPRTFTKDNYQKTYHHWDDDWGREGGVLRCDPLGQHLEIVSRGMRNPWDIAFDDGFNWLGTDNDQDQGDRIIMPFFGAHFGWGHSYSSHWTGENHLPTAPISAPVFPGSGTGIIFYAHPHFPLHYRNVFFINDWMHGTYIYRPVWDGALMQPEEGRWQPFATRGDGRMLYRPTDLEFAADGSIYICGWGGDYHYDRGDEGSWLFQVRHARGTQAGEVAQKRHQPYAQWSVEQLVQDLGPEVLPVWRVRAQDELVRRGDDVRDELTRAIESLQLEPGQQTWALWALGRIGPDDNSIDAFMQQLARPTAKPGTRERWPLNLRLQALRILAYRVRHDAQHELADELVMLSLGDPEPRIRFEAVQAIWQARQTRHRQALINHLAQEQDRLVFYSGWQALRDLSSVADRKRLLDDERAGVRLAALLSLLEQREISLDEVLELADNDDDQRIQNWALTWAINPRPPQKMPNTTARVELEESVSIRDLIDRATKASKPRTRHLYLNMISRATYRDRHDWQRIRDFYGELDQDDERALVLVPLSRDDRARAVLWAALAGDDALRRAAINGLTGLSRRARNSPAELADFLLKQTAYNPQDPRAPHAMTAMSRFAIAPGWQPSADWDAVMSEVFAAADLATRARILTVLLSMDPAHLAQGKKMKRVLETEARAPAPQLYGQLLTLNPRLGIEVAMQPPPKATIDGVLAKLPHADVQRGRELFFGKESSIGCAACHRISGWGNSFAPDLSGIGLRSEPKTIVQSILEPSAVITEGYQRQVFETRDGLVLAGAVLGETNSQVRLIKSDGTLDVIETASVEHRQKTSESAMPANYALLGEDQLANIVAFLASCRHGDGDSSERTPSNTLHPQREF